jgi:predicted transcriptional regulator
MAEILDSLISNPLKKTHITFKCNLDSRAVTKYLSIMQDVGLVEKSSSDKSLYKITEKGVRYRNQFNSFVNMMEEDIQRIASQRQDSKQLLENLKLKIRN